MFLVTGIIGLVIYDEKASYWDKAQFRDTQ